MPARRRLWLPDQAADPYDDLANLLTAMHPDQLEAYAAGLPREDVALLEQVMAARHSAGWRTDPATFAHHLDPTYRTPPYVRLLSGKFRQAVDGTSRRQIWNLPARLGKSLLGSQWGPTWCIDFTGGTARLILWSYGKALAVENAVGCRDRLMEHADQLNPGAHLAPGRRRMDRFVTLAGGGVLAAGVGAAVRGFGAGAGGGIIADDPFKDWQEAHSENRRNLVWNQYRGTLLDRLDDEQAFIIVIHHRVHEDDLTGRLLEDMAQGGEEWDVTVLSAVAVEGRADPIGRTPGESLDPDRFSAAFYVSQARAMGSYLWSALGQQDPSPEEGTELLRGWFQLYEQGPVKPDEALTSWDLKLKDREAGDFVVGQCWWRTGPDNWLVDQLRGHYDHATTANAIALLAVRHPEVRRHVVESAGSADEVLPQLRKPMPGYEVDTEMAGRLGMNEAEREQVARLRRRGMGGLVAEGVKGDKSVRARAFIAPAAEAGNVHLPAYAEFTPHLLDEIAAFPNGSHDDQVDAMSQALKRLTKGGASASAPTGSTPPTRPSQRRAAGSAAVATAPGRATVLGPVGRRRPGRA